MMLKSTTISGAIAVTELDLILERHLREALGLPVGLALRVANDQHCISRLHAIRKQLEASEPAFAEIYIRRNPLDRAVIWLTKVPGRIGRPKLNGEDHGKGSQGSA